MTMLSVDAQMGYLVQWFNEWSELQRTDFLPVLAEKLSNVTYVNGIVNSISGVNCQDKPMSLFECRVKLFREWVPTWTPEQRQQLAQRISEIDPAFGEKLNSELQNGTPSNGVVNNGIINNGIVNNGIVNNGIAEVDSESVDSQQ